ncbi:MFS transporter [Bacillus velezensis]|uniref:MFS transporter n=1 Tax=Bacillus velezensis TaxID=492670 RepID=UPI003862494C
MTPHALAPLVIGTLVRRYGNWVTLKLFYLLAAVFIFIIPFTISPMALYVVQILIGFSLGIIFPLLLGMSIESVPADMRATSMGIPGALCTRYFRRTFGRGIF